MFAEHSMVVLTHDVAGVEASLRAGDVGTIVHIHNEGEAYEVEFFSVNGQTIAVETVWARDLRPVTDQDVLQARALA